MIVLNVTYKCKAGKRNDFLDVIQKEGIDEARDAEFWHKLQASNR